MKGYDTAIAEQKKLYMVITGKKMQELTYPYFNSFLTKNFAYFDLIIGKICSEKFNILLEKKVHDTSEVIH